MTSLKTSIKTITYLSDTGCLEIQGASLAVYRRLILMKAMSNITDCSVPDINRMLRFMFGKKRRAYVLNNGGLRMSYIFESALSLAELAIIQSSGALPSPPGVYVSVVLKESRNEGQ